MLAVPEMYIRRRSGSSSSTARLNELPYCGAGDCIGEGTSNAVTSWLSVLMAINPESRAAPRRLRPPIPGAGRQQALVDLLLLEELVANAVEIAIPAENVVVVEPGAEHVAEDHAGVVQQSVHLAEDRGGLLGPTDPDIRRQQARQPAVLNEPILEHASPPGGR